MKRNEAELCDTFPSLTAFFFVRIERKAPPSHLRYLAASEKVELSIPDISESIRIGMYSVENWKFIQIVH